MIQRQIFTAWHQKRNEIQRACDNVMLRLLNYR